MRIITISREFGSGGREIGKRLADSLGFDYYDSEILSAVAEKNRQNSAEYVEQAFTNHGWHNYPLRFGQTINSSVYMQSSKLNLLHREKKIIEEIAALGKDFVIVGRNSDVILKRFRPLDFFICADTETKIKRCKERAHEGEDVSKRVLLRKMRDIDKNRSRTRKLLGGAAWGKREAYHLIINTSDWKIKDLIPILSSYAKTFFEKAAES